VRAELEIRPSSEAKTERFRGCSIADANEAGEKRIKEKSEAAKESGLAG
jgi:hypothetical protein